ncbi:glycosyltransferase family 4 protein [Pleurocapsales cyanobacterium LEGE 10410]|nr:glycosyltransferase family 4 protein [Pleurocapsales cyanobacterium LEGE 10410]
MIKCIAYLAPEIPSISGTFVYKEIITLQDKGIEIIPLSVHRPKVIVQDSKVKELSNNTIYLYQQSLLSALINSILLLLNKPNSYITTLSTVFDDIFSSGFGKLKSWKLLYQFFYAGLVAQILEKNSCQYLHIHFASVPTQIGMYASSLTGIPFSFTSHANDLFENKLLLKDKVERAKTAVTISQYNYEFLAQQGVDTDKLKIVRCGIDINKHDFMPRRTLKKPPTIGSLGRLIEKKGMDDLVLALSKLHHKGVDFRLEIGGEGHLNDYLQELAVTHQIRDKIEFKGAIPNDRVYSWLENLDIFVLACKKDSQGDRDGIPVVLMEAMTIGVPVISTRISGIPELIEDEQSGFLAEPNSPESLASAIEKLLGWSEPISDLTQAARNRVVEEFELQSNVDRLLSVFNG